MAHDAGVSLSRTATQVPIATHAAMSASLVVSVLGSVALPAQLLYLAECELLAIGEAKPGLVAVGMTAGAGEVSVANLDSEMERVQLGA